MTTQPPIHPAAPPSITPCGFAPAPLEGAFVRLEPLTPEHARPLWEISQPHLEQIFWGFPIAMRTLDDFEREIGRRYPADLERGVSVAFATTLRESRHLVGSTRFLAIDTAHRHAEIGFTWVIPAWQRTAVNTEAKFLMLRYAFEQAGCLRVEFKTDALNQQSRAALTRLGAKEEGIFRKHMVMPTGRIRDSVYFSIIDTEWPAVKSKLEARLAR